MNYFSFTNKSTFSLPNPKNNTIFESLKKDLQFNQVR
jgi:hypothetical protein